MIKSVPQETRLSQEKAAPAPCLGNALVESYCHLVLTLLNHFICIALRVQAPPQTSIKPGVMFVITPDHHA